MPLNTVRPGPSAPLSLVKMTKVFSARPSCWSFCHDAANIGVEAGDHRRVIFYRLRPRAIRKRAGVRDFVLAVRQRPGSITEERAIFIRFDEFQRLVGDQVGRICVAFARFSRNAIAAGHRHADAISDQKCRKVIVRMRLVVVAVENVEPLLSPARQWCRRYRAPIYRIHPWHSPQL